MRNTLDFRDSRLKSQQPLCRLRMQRRSAGQVVRSNA